MRNNNSIKARNRNILMIGSLLILLCFVFMNVSNISNWIGHAFDLLIPFILGFAIAFFINPLVKFFEYNVFNKFKLKDHTIHLLSALSGFIMALIILIIIIAVIVPQFIDSLHILGTKWNEYLHDSELLLNDISKKYHLNLNIKNFIGNSGNIFHWLTTHLDFKTLLPSFAQFSFKAVHIVIDIFIGLVAGFYLLLDRDRFLYEIKKANYRLLKPKHAQYLYHATMVSKQVFYDFVIGKAIDSAIIGFLCYLGMNLLGLEYSVLLSVIVAITNMIPVFGPIIGAIPGLFILFIINPWHGILFGIFILILQQIDGNIIGPLIIGDKLGLPSFWILFAVTIGGGLFGVIGMFIGVPIFTVIYNLLMEYINNKPGIS